ncbi:MULTISPECIES: hypothetical protein [Sphingomonadales]|uniref:hypothetical protein n=1 Tax=Sphingomonadales TaxID=204457 RepID=UPI0006C92F67|nr:MULTISPECIES: hypothetical protein [Sphingomonadales]MCB2062209.1 hypothetical protein [Novosphingobium sp.]PKP99754.1 MAG: hypothetical protein CVT74_06860 [Alphaproteobacteria bacterium HGW-Alphaproteobacteria-13]
MTILRAFAVLCMSFGLFVQVAAHAAAVPQLQVAEMDCAEMHQSAPGQMSMQDQVPDDSGPCKNKTLDCLVAMNCIPPLFMSDTTAGSVALQFHRPLYQASGKDWLPGSSSAPEPPPPETIS